MKQIIVIAMLASVFSCTPYQKLMLIPANRNEILMDSCDLSVIRKLSQSLDTTGSNETFEQTRILEAIVSESECGYVAHKFYSPREDSTRWLLIIRPVTAGKDEIILGNLYTLHPKKDSSYIYQRRVKEYSQMNDFESGKYIVFTYTVLNDSTTIVKTGASIH
jgi:hypothetical protein